MSIDRTETIKMACAMLDQGKTVSAADMIRQNYPFTPIKKNGRKYTPRQMTRVFLRDGFIDRYRGTRLVHPPALRLLSHYLPECFPYHKNGKMNEAHIAYWELFPTIDHLVPVARGGIDSEENWVCCSMLTNSIKSNWLLEELQWDLKSPGNPNVWDGMLSWFLRHVDEHKELLAIGYIKTWFHAGMEISLNRAARGF